MRRLACALPIVVTLLAGCALTGGAPQTRRETQRRSAGPPGAVRRHPPGALVVAQRTHEYPSPAPPLERAPSRPSAELALLLFATAYVNWNAYDVAARLRALATASVGQARSAMQLQAAQVAADPQLRSGGIANHGSVEAVAPLIGGGGNRYVVVTREWTTASASAAYQGLLPAWHLTLATVRQQGHGWVVSGWQPES